MLRLLFTILFLSLSIIPGYCTDQWVPTAPQHGDDPKVYPAAVQSNNNSLSRILNNYREGQILTYSSGSTIAVTAGEIACNSATPIVLRQNTSSTNITTANLDTGVSFTINTTYYVYAVCDASATTNTYFISLSSTTPVGATNYKRLGSFVTDGSANITRVIANDNIPATYSFGDYVAKSSGVNYQAATDGYLVGNINETNSGFMFATIYSDATATPSTVIQKMTLSGGTSYAVPFNVPIKKGNYYRIDISGSVTLENCYFMSHGV